MSDAMLMACLTVWALFILAIYAPVSRQRHVLAVLDRLVDAIRAWRQP
jgi:hypothetical protein